jgi:serine/threonine protein phosphatase PrpC
MNVTRAHPNGTAKRTPMLRVATSIDSFRGIIEDRLFVREVPGGVVVVLADGAGGIPGGGEAADRLVALARHALSAPSFDPFSAGTWVDLMHSADGEIEKDPSAGETTAVIVTVWERHIWGASAGDSGALIVHPRGHDDLTANQKRKRRLGNGMAHAVPFERGDWDGCLVVASDGLFDHARPEAVSRAVFGGDVDDAPRRLIDCVRLPSGELVDDVAVAVIHREIVQNAAILRR